jgi:DNA-binding transcriptional regulator YiaG
MERRQTMIIEGNYFKSGKFWVASIPAVDTSTQSLRRNALSEMILDLLSSLCDQKVEAEISFEKNGKFTIETQSGDMLFPLVLKRQREKNGFSQREAAENLGYRSVNAYSAYEQGQRRPSLAKADELLRAVGGKRRLRLAIG